MEFLEEEARPRFLFHSRASKYESHHQPPGKLNKRLVFLCASLAIFLLVFVFFTQSEALKALILWFSLSLLLGPFAPVSITGGDIHVGQGKQLKEPSSDLDPNSHLDEPKKRLLSKRNKTRNSDDPPTLPLVSASNSSGSDQNLKELVGKTADSVSNGEGSSDSFEEEQWTDQDFDLLKKQMLKHPVGESKRWELISEAFRGRHMIDIVIKMGKSMGERRPSNDDSFSQFLKQRKPLDGRLVVSNDEDEEALGEGQIGEKPMGWSAGEDLALLNALKAFPKEVSMRWEKIAAAVSGRSKAACMKRVAQLKKDFRSSKASIDS